MESWSFGVISRTPVVAKRAHQGCGDLDSRV
jgi:hypothetical protein